MTMPKAYLVFPRHIPIAEYSSATAVVTGYEPIRMMYGTPRWGCRSASDAAFVAVFDAGANGLYVADTVLYRGNGNACTVNFNATDSWGTPSAGATASAIIQTIAAANRTLAGGKITLTNGITLTPHKHKGSRLRFTTSDTQHDISDNDATGIWVHGTDLSAKSGDVQILAGAGWITLTKAEYRFIQVATAAQDTVEEYHRIDSLIIGQRTELDTNWYAPISGSIPGAAGQTSSGGRWQRAYGPRLRSWALTGLQQTDAQYYELSNRIYSQGNAPIAFVPNSNIPTDWALVLPSFDIDWSPESTVIRLDEVA